MKHVFSVIGLAVAVLLLTSRWFASHAHLTHGREYIAAAAIIAVFHLAGIAAARALRPKAAATPVRTASPYYTGPRR